MENKRKVIITVSAQVGSCKSGVLYLIKEALEKQGLNVDFECPVDYHSLLDFEREVGLSMGNKIDFLKNNVDIKLEDKQLPMKEGSW